ncbi:hypothetical protein ACIQTU_07115 [Brevundimonas sp. NPDC090276]|uniref:hypothetical protein n=1 Tax=Brevundimonas sp. NPDC090276 TaxID=3363956 RepID=UPI00383BE9C3
MTTRKTIAFVSAISAALLLPGAVSAQNTTSERSALLSELGRCRTLAVDTERLACFDHAAGALEVAERQGDVVVVDRGQIREARRQLFGFEMPALTSMFSRDEAEEKIDAVETSLVSAGQGLDGKWLFRLADGSEWRQIDSAPVRFQNRAGMDVRVRRAALGSYQLTAGRSRAVRVRRQ